MKIDHERVIRSADAFALEAAEIISGKRETFWNFNDDEMHPAHLFTETYGKTPLEMYRIYMWRRAQHTAALKNEEAS